MEDARSSAVPMYPAIPGAVPTLQVNSGNSPPVDRAIGISGAPLPPGGNHTHSSSLAASGGTVSDTHAGNGVLMGATGAAASADQADLAVLVRVAEAGGGIAPPAGLHTTDADSQQRVATFAPPPSRVRVDSRTVLLHCTSNWISNGLVALILLLKLEQSVTWSWWVVFAPFWFYHCVNIYLQGFALYFRGALVEKSIGPPPPPTGSPSVLLQYNLLRSIRVKSHTIDAINSLVDSSAIFLVKVLLCYQLHAQSLTTDPAATPAWWSFRLIFLPCWLSWAITFVLIFRKEKQERVFGSARDLQYIFLLFVALKLDGRSQYSWRIVFLVPWIWFAAIFLLASLVGTLLLLARFWRRVRELLLPLGFLSLLLACIPQFISYLTLVVALDQVDVAGHTDITFAAVLLPNAASWFLMWAASLVLVAGLRQKEVAREHWLATSHDLPAEHDIPHLPAGLLESTQRAVDNLSDEKIAVMVEEMMRGKPKPASLMRVGDSLYRILAGSTVAPLKDAEEGGASRSAWRADADRSGVPPLEAPLPPPGRSPGRATPPPADRGPAGIEIVTVPGAVVDHHPESLAVLSVNGEDSECGPGMVHPEAAPPRSAMPAEEEEEEEDPSCIVCYDAPPTCVFLTCGHGGVCRRCAYKLFVRPPNECPTCRQAIEQVVELEQASKQVGDVLRVL
eukprot:jgi/Tetstr1/466760/TSEL_011230.t1